MITLRPYQLDMVEQTRSAMRSKKSILVQLSTGGGKTALASYMVASAVNKGSPVFFCVHRKDLIRQTSLTFNEFGIKHSFIASENPFNPYATAHICSIDTLRGRLGKVPIPKIVFIDECHMANSESWSKIINFFKARGAWIIGLTATPVRTDGTAMGKHFEVMIEGPKMSWLIENKFLSDYKMYTPSSPDLSGIATRAGDYAKDQLAARFDNDPVIIGDMIYHYKKYANGKMFIAYCVSRKHSNNVADKFTQNGIKAKHIDGETPMEERLKIIRDLADGVIQGITNAALISTGFDLASQVGRNINIECIIDGAPTKSESLYLQKLGRGMRYKEDPSIFLDHAGNCAQHGLPDEDRVWTLEEKKKRKRNDDEQEKTIAVRQCPECHFAHRPKPECPNCGWTYPILYREIEEIEGELQEINAQMLRREKRMQQGMAKTLEDLTAAFIGQGMTPWKAKARAGYVLRGREAKRNK